ncbi:MAG: stalk domain-containing protein [Syntrophomonadaceae bacterium]
MRKRLCILFLVLGVFFSLPASADPTVILNCKQVESDVPALIQDDTVLVPLGAVIKPLGAQIGWSQASQTIFVKMGMNVIILYPGRSDVLVNGYYLDLTAPVQVVNGRTMVPLQFFTLALGADSDWDKDKQVVVINAAVSASPDLKSAARVHFIDVGLGDAIYIQLPDKIDILIDGGNLDAEGTVLSYLKEKNVNDLELVIATNDDAHHIGALPAVLEKYEVKKLIYNETAASRELDNLLKTAQTKNIPMETFNYQTWSWGDATLKILNGPVAEGIYEAGSIISRLEVGDIDFLFMSDAGAKGENALKGDIETRFIKVGDHASAAATSYEFINRVKPKVAIITTIGDNPVWYEHDPNTPPDPEVMDRLKQQGCKILRTDLDGDIVVVTDGQTYQIKVSAE